MQWQPGCGVGMISSEGRFDLDSAKRTGIAAARGPSLGNKGGCPSGPSRTRMSIRFRCPSCKMTLNAPADYAGGAATCQKCGTRIRIPNPAHGDLPRSARAAPTSTPTSSSSADVRPFTADGRSTGKAKSPESDTQSQRRRRLPVLGIIIGVAVAVIGVEAFIAVRVVMEQSGSAGGGEEPASITTTEPVERASPIGTSSSLTYDPVAHDIVLMLNRFLPQLRPVYESCDFRWNEVRQLSGRVSEERDTSAILRLTSDLLENMRRLPSDCKNVLDVASAYAPFTNELSLVHSRLLKAFGWLSRAATALVSEETDDAGKAVDNYNDGLVAWATDLQRLAQRHGHGKLVSLERLASRFGDLGPGG